MNKNFRLVCILSLVLSLIAIAWNTLAGFFFGFGVNFVAMLSVFAIVYMLVIENKTLYEETKSLFYVDLSIVCFELVVFIMEEFFGRFGKILYVFTVIQKIFSVFAILYFVYTLLKLLFHEKEMYGGVFRNLFKRNKPVKQKKAKEFTNGSLSEKPTNSHNEDNVLKVLENGVDLSNEDEGEE